MHVARGLTLAAILACGVASAALAQDSIPDGDWRTINRDLNATRYSPLKQINAANVSGLKDAWSYQLKTFSSAVPLVVDGVMYMTANNRMVALDAATGKEIWVHERPAPAPAAAPAAAGGQRERPSAAPGFSARGLGYWPGDKSHGPRLLATAGTTLVALDAKTGKRVAGFGNNGEVDIKIAFGGVPTIAGYVAIIGAASLENPQGNSGNPRAFDVVTGKKLWEFDTTPDEGQPYNDTWGGGAKDRGGANMWGFMATVDTDTSTAYLPIAGPAHNYYGGDRPGADVFGNSLVAVDLETGKYKWHFQTVHHDLWDIDMSSAGPLIPVHTASGMHKAIANIGKASLFYVIDAETGKPALPVEERPVPPGDVPGEYYSPTEPFPVNTPPLSRLGMTYQDIVTAEDTTEGHAAACRAMWAKAGGYYNAGPFTPFMFHPAGAPPRSTIQFPSGTGGVNWGGPAADPTTGIVYVNAQEGSLVGWVEKVEGDKPYSFDATSSPPYDRASVDGKGPFFSFAAPISGKYDDQGRADGPTAPCFKPPWSHLTAVDANTGEIKWAVPLGITEGLPKDKQLTGNSGSAGPTVTAGGLVFVGATNDKRFRAFDAATGAQLWETQLQGNANANAMTYLGHDGKQYVAVNASGVIRVFALRQ